MEHVWAPRGYNNDKTEQVSHLQKLRLPDLYQCSGLSVQDVIKQGRVPPVEQCVEVIGMGFESEIPNQLLNGLGKATCQK